MVRSYLRLQAIADRAGPALVVYALALAACGRLGFGELAEPAADGGAPVVPGEVAPDAAEHSDASATFDASAMPDASATLDASGMLDAALAPDAAASDASAAPDASAPVDAALTTDAAPSCTPSASRDYCMQVPALSFAPQLDGVLDCGPSLIELPASGWNSTRALPSDNHARYAAAWRPDGLYVYVEVDDMLLLPALASDVDPWCGDGVELYVDADGRYGSPPGYDYPGTIQLLATSPARSANSALAVDARYHTRSQLRVGDWAASRHVMVPRANGYALEAFVAAAELDLSSWRLASGGTIGMDIAINVSVTDETQKVGCGHNLGQYYLRVSRLPCTSDSCRPYSNVASFCTPVLE